MSGYLLERLNLGDMEAAARIHRKASWIASLHTPVEDKFYFEEIVFPHCEVWGAKSDSGLVGIIAFRFEWIDQLQVLPDWQARGAGSALLEIAKSQQSYLQLWTFQGNARARRFYERRGFRAVEETDGARNEEKEPDVRYEWRAGTI